MEHLVLGDGRRLAYRWFGPEGGKPLLFFHGTPGTHMQAELASEQAARHGYRLLAMDRPGLGESDFQPGRRVEDWPQDIAALLDHLGVDHAGIVAISGGCPYALQAAYALRERIPYLILLSGWASYGREGLHAPDIPGFFKLYRWALAHAPFVARRMAASVHWLSQREPSEAARNAALKFFVEDDRRLMSDPQLFSLVLRDFKHAFALGKDGPAQEAALQLGKPEIELFAVTQPVHLWHGTADNIAPYAMAEYHKARLPDATLHTVPEGGHLCAADQELQMRIFAVISTL